VLWSKNFNNGESTAMGFKSGTALVVIGGLYAGVHLALWNYAFPTRAEMLLWKISCCTLGFPLAFIALSLIVGFGVLACLFLYEEIEGNRIVVVLGNSLVSMRSYWENFDRLRHETAWIKYSTRVAVDVFKGTLLICFLAIGLAMFATVPLYGFARVYIILESLMSLRRVPLGVYQGITWEQYIPHL
jgi:hypothetical protein